MPATYFGTSQPGGNTYIDNWDVANSSTPSTRALRQQVGVIQHAPNRSWGQWYNIRGQRFIATTDYVVLSGNTNSQLLACLINHDTGNAATNTVLVLDKAEFGSAYQTTFSRFGTTEANITLVAGQTQKPVGRSDGGAATSNIRIYTAGNGTANVRGTNGTAQFSIPGGSPGTLRKVAMMNAYSAYMLSDITTALQPGQAAYWSVDEPAGGVSGNFNAYIDFEWVEIPKNTWDAMATELQARLDY